MNRLSLKSTFIFLLLGPVLWGQDSLNMNLLYHWEDTNIVSDVVYGSRYNEIWGVAQGGREYAIMGTTTGTYVFDVTDPSTADVVDFLPGSNNPGAQFVVHRDYHDYGGYLYMVSDEDRIGLQIYDMQYLPDSLSLVYNSDTLFERSHNIFIDSAAQRLYVCALSTVSGLSYPLNVYSLADPLDPSFEFTITGFGHAHDVFARNDTAYINAGTSGGLWIMDLTTGTPQLLNNLSNYPDRGYNHSGWLSEDGEIYVFADETYGTRLKVCDVSDPSNPIILDTVGSGVDTNSVAHNLMIKDDLLYVSYYHDGLQIFDISNPSSVNKVAYFDTYLPPDHSSYRGNWGVYAFLPSGRILASDMQSGLFVLGLDPVVLATEARLSEQKDWGLHIFPNPIQSEFFLEFDFEEIQNLRADLYSVDGKWIETLFQNEQLEKGRKQLSVAADLPAGQYFIRLHSPKMGGASIKITKT